MLIKEYNPNWVQSFENIKLEIQNILKGIDYTIQHVGSTAVPELASKPIIDIDIIFQNESEFEKIKSALLSIGYFHNGNQGIKDREVFKRNGLSEHVILDKIKHHLYACPIYSKALSRHILFRDYLRKDEYARIQYQTIKYELAEKANQNKKVYAELKELTINKFIDKLIEN